MRTIGNILWFILGGWLSGLLWCSAALLMAISIVGIPFARGAWNIGVFSFLPFGKQVINRQEVTEKLDLGTSVLGSLGNVIWFVVAGLWIGIFHIGVGIALFCSIIGIPFALQHFKLAQISFIPIGAKVVSNHLYTAVKIEQAKQQLNAIRSA